MKNEIENAWLEYEDMVVPKEAGEIQRAETRGAFIAGMFSFNIILKSIASSENHEGMTKQVLELNTALENEIIDYRNKIAIQVYNERKEVLNE